MLYAKLNHLFSTLKQILSFLTNCWLQILGNIHKGNFHSSLCPWILCLLAVSDLNRRVAWVFMSTVLGGIGFLGVGEGGSCLRLWFNVSWKLIPSLGELKIIGHHQWYILMTPFVLRAKMFETSLNSNRESHRFDLQLHLWLLIHTACYGPACTWSHIHHFCLTEDCCLVGLPDLSYLPY